MKVETTIQSQTRKASQITLELGRKGGIVVDKLLNAESKNPVANSTVTAAWDILNRALVAANKESAEIKASVQANAENIGKTNEAVEKNAADIVKANEEIAKKANTDKHYPKLTAGFADNLVGRGEATAEEFTFRPSAGEKSIGDEGAKITEIKGNALVWNQLVENKQFAFSASSGIYDNGIYTITPTGDYPGISQTSITKIPIGHKLLVVVSVKSNVVLRLGLNYFGASAQASTSSDSVFHTYGLFATSTMSSPYAGLIVFATAAKEQFYMSQPKVYDLTKMFGAGNEPTTIEDFYACVPSGVDINAYNAGEIIPMNAEAIKTVGFNQWDEQWELGSISFADGGNVVSTNQIRSKNYIPILPNQDYYWNLYGYVRCYDKEKKYLGGLLPASDNGWSNGGIIKASAFPVGTAYLRFWLSSSYGTTYKNDICFNLSHTGVNNGKYQPYTPFTRELSVIGKCFKNGMRSVGTTHDSIEWDSTKQKWVAVPRIGERAYMSGDESNAAVLTDNTTTLYKLAEPIVTEIDESLNLNYYVEDFGTEEAMSSVPSAPFRADIVYPFNAVDTIRNNALAIQELRSAIATMQAQMASLAKEE